MILVTGATGLVGNNIVRQLLEQQQDVRVLVRESSDPRPLEGLNVETVRGDVRDESSVRRACEGVRQVIHAAAHVQIGWSGLAQQRAINVNGTRAVAQAARACGARMVHVSSVDALGLGSAQQPADESTPIGGKTPCPYVVTKTEAEAALREEIARGLDAVIMNPGFMLGPWDWKPSSGQMLVEVGKRFAPLAPTGGCSACDVRDVAAATIVALEHGQRGQNYILGGFNQSYFELWQLFSRVAGSRPPIGRLGPVLQFLAGRGGDTWARVFRREPPVNSAALAMSSLTHYYSSDRARRELGYCTRPLEETVADAWDWFKRHGYV
jgi:dihydroflavonol-4-reductase